MSSHHHHHHHSCCCCCCCSCSPPPLPPSNACTSNADAILQALTANLLLQSPTLPPPSAHFPYPYLNPHRPHPYHHHLYHPLDDQISDERLLRRQHYHQAGSLHHSLAQRAAALDTSFLSSHPPPTPPPPEDKKQHKHHAPLSSPGIPTSTPRPPVASSSPSPLRTSLRDLAARTIQAAFRRHLVRRSQTLRQLKDLAVVKSHVAALRSAASDEKCLDPEALSERAMNLFLRLDAIQSADPMTREGKRSISRELSRILDFIDKVLLKGHLLTPEAADIESNDDRRRINGKTPARKVRFFDDAKSETSFGRHESGDSGDASYENGRAESLVGELIGTAARDDLTESNGSYQVSDNEGSSEDSAADGTGGKHAKSSHFIAAPMPVQMEARKR